MTDSKNDEPQKASSATAESPAERSPWYVAGIFGALGFEFVGFIVGGYVVGAFIDHKLGTGPWGAVTCVLLGLLGALWHIYRVAKNFME